MARITITFSDHVGSPIYECDSFEVKPTIDGQLRTTMRGRITIDGKLFTYRGGKRYDTKRKPLTVMES